VNESIPTSHQEFRAAVLVPCERGARVQGGRADEAVAVAGAGERGVVQSEVGGKPPERDQQIFIAANCAKTWRFSQSINNGPKPLPANCARRFER